VRSVDQPMRPLLVATRSPSVSLQCSTRHVHDGQSLENVKLLVRVLRAAVTIAAVHAASDPAGTDCPVETRLCPTATLVTTSTVTLPWTKPLVRTRETAIGNFVAGSMGAFLTARCEPARPRPIRVPGVAPMSTRGER
jgi:hypothetical protein